MALIAHYPLNGDTKDYSGYGNGGVSTGAVVSNTGKIGRCYKFDGISSGINIPNKNYSGMEVYSMTAWVKPLGQHKNYNGAVISSGNWNSSAWNFGLSQDNSKIDVASNSYNRYLDYPVPVGEWTHIVCVAENNVTKVYVNGNYIGQVSTTSKLASNAANTYIGRETYGGGYFSFNGELNDIRIYDHALSDKEIKELAKAKVLHYKFDEHEVISENLIPNPTRVVDMAKPSREFNRYIDLAPILEGEGIEKTYSLSMDLKSDNISNNSMVQIYMQNGSGTKYNFVNKSVKVSEEYSRYYFEGLKVSINDSSLTEAWLAMYGSYGTDNRVSMKNVQLEVGSKCTPFVYSSKTSTTIKDSSGFRNDGTVALATAPTWSEDSPVGRGSMEFSGAKFITLPNMLGSDEQITVCAWFKANGSGGSGYHIIFGGTEVELDVTSDGQARFGLIVNNVRQVHNYSSGLADGKYHHICGVYDGTVKDVYVDGVLVGSYPVVGKIKNNITRRVGVFGTDTRYHANGNISDVRIYATALTPEDILELYQTRASVDNEGNLFVQEIDEISDTSKEVDSRGVARFKEFNEVGGENKMSIKNDGVVYVNEIMEA